MQDGFFEWDDKKADENFRTPDLLLVPPSYGEFTAETQRTLSFCSVSNRTNHVKPNIVLLAWRWAAKKAEYAKQLKFLIFLCVSAVSSPLVAALPRCEAVNK